MTCLRVLLPVVFVALTPLGCEPSARECSADVDCATGRCDAAGSCVECLSNGDCDGGICCQGSCSSAGVNALCGCGPGESDSGPSNCGTDVCLSNGAPATADTVASGVCACPCDPAQGGTVCGVSDVDASLTCSCDRSDPVGTCEAPAIDAAGLPHRPADTCSPQNQCVCFADGDVCAGSADCTSAGCVDLVADGDNCGVAGRVCDNEDTGAVGGSCQGGGCTCNAASDCQGAGLNVDTCAFIGAVSQCVCDAYDSAGSAAACPMGFECRADGCVFEGTAFTTRDALVEALRNR